MRVFPQALRPDIALIVLYLLAGLPLQWWAYFVAAIPFMNYGPPAWTNFPAYLLAGPLAAYLLWRGSPRARLATYVFLTFDVLRSARLAHWLPMAIDMVIVLYLQTPAMRRMYPSMWSQRKRMLLMWGRK
jgi:hypothetical protein